MTAGHSAQGTAAASQARKGGECLRLLHVMHSFELGGMELLTAGLMNAFGGRATHQVLTLRGTTLAASRLNPSVQISFLRTPESTGLARIFQLRGLIRAAQPDLLLTYNWGGMDGVMAAALAPFCPIVHHEHGFSVDEALQRRPRRVLIRRLFLNRIHATVVVSRYLERVALKEYRVSPGRLRFIQTGVEAERFSPGSAPEWRRRFGIPEAALVFGFLGRLRPEKNLDMLVAAFGAAKLDTAWLAIVGGGELRSEIEAKIRSSGARTRIVLAGPTDDPAEALRAFDVFVMSSLTEQTPLALLEAMSCGLPAIVTDAGDCGAVLGTSQPPQVIRTGDIPACADAMRNFAEDGELRAAHGAANRRRVLENYSFGRMADDYELLYRQAAGRVVK